ncbi:MAG: cobalamin-binding protein [Woeseiaceae bacterium]|jgi:iron complex transport system substrate-binding protein|nr:cobalamin-binding protein [Woeseiaceae bacterium]
MKPAGRGWLLPLLVLLAACAPEPDAAPDTASASRIVALAPHLAELVYAAGAGDMLVGVSAYTDYPAEAAELPVVSDAFTVDQERLRLLAPDLVLAWDSGMPAHTIDGLKQSGFRVITLRTRSLADITESLETIGRLTGRTAEARAEAERFRNAIAGIRAQYAAATSIRVFFQVSARPLYTINGEHFISELIEACGAVNVFADLGELAPAIDVEAVLAADPEAIITGSGSTQLDTWRRFSTLSATRAGNLLTIDAPHLSRASTRLDDAARTLCAVIETARRDLVFAD